jgi:hypothetical protein
MLLFASIVKVLIATPFMALFATKAKSIVRSATRIREPIGAASSQPWGNSGRGIFTSITGKYSLNLAPIHRSNRPANRQTGCRIPPSREGKDISFPSACRVFPPPLVVNTFIARGAQNGKSDWFSKRSEEMVGFLSGNRTAVNQRVRGSKPTWRAKSLKRGPTRCSLFLF